ncbi:fimbrillin family protein [Bacteroides stercoris]|uniref:fimbrillin family protein n=1 Tax=Bacteroides stercoris TaxID=46506 RepID=UPI0018A05A54|nr:fimbrillin family protein [Bacteroides stercoris]
MSKKKNISYLFGLAFLLLAGCDTDTATVPLPDDGERAVEVRLRASVCTVETTVGRSVIEGTALNTGDEIGIFLMRDSNFSTPYLQNLPYRYAEGGQLSLQPEGAKVYYPARQDTLYLYGYYPYTATAAADENGKVSIPVTAALEAKDATDYLYTGETKGSKKAAATAAGIAVSLKHALARLRLNISTDRPEYTADSYPVLQSIGFTTREGQTGTMDLQTGDITSDSPDTGTSVSSDYRNESSPLNLIPGTAGIQKDYLLLPYGHETISALRRLTFSIKEPDGSEKDIVVFDEADAGANTPPLIVLEAGSITTLNILYTQSMAAKASVNDWNKGTEHTFQ